MWRLHRHTVAPLVIIHDFNIDRLPVAPHEADPVAVIDADTVLTCAILPQRLKLKAGTPQIVQRRRGVQDCELPIRYVRHGCEFRDRTPLKMRSVSASLKLAYQPEEYS